MTLETSKRLYEHYKSINYASAMNDLLKKYPELEDKKDSVQTKDLFIKENEDNSLSVPKHSKSKKVSQNGYKRVK